MMRKTVQRSIQLYGYTGLIPFWGLVVMETLGYPALDYFINYSVVILSFLAGAYWFGSVSNPEVEKVQERLFMAIALSLFAWSTTFLPAHFALKGLALGFLIMYWIECWSPIKNSYPAVYFHLRTHLTLAAILAHLAYVMIL